jgi:hypothetical protein
MRPLNAASYIMIEGLEGLAPDGLPGHRRGPSATGHIGGVGKAKPSPRTRPTRNAHSKRQTHQTASPQFTEI